MVFTLTPGEAIQIGDVITLTVLAVEDDLIRLGLEAPEGASPLPGDAGKDNEEADPKHRWNGWELN
jgi:hypothetical protein